MKTDLILPSFCSALPPGSVNFSAALFHVGVRFSRLRPSHLPTALAMEVLKNRAIGYTRGRRFLGEEREMRCAVVLLDGAWNDGPALDDKMETTAEGSLYLCLTLLAM